MPHKFYRLELTKSTATTRLNDACQTKTTKQVRTRQQKRQLISGTTLRRWLARSECLSDKRPIVLVTRQLRIQTIRQSSQISSNLDPTVVSISEDHAELGRRSVPEPLSRSSNLAVICRDYQSTHGPIWITSVITEPGRLIFHFKNTRTPGFACITLLSSPLLGQG